MIAATCEALILAEGTAGRQVGYAGGGALRAWTGASSEKQEKKKGVSKTAIQKPRACYLGPQALGN